MVEMDENSAIISPAVRRRCATLRRAHQRTGQLVPRHRRCRGDLVIGDDDDRHVGWARQGGESRAGGWRSSAHVVVEDGACIGAGAHVDAGTRVPAGWIYAGRPARPFRELKPAEREGFADIIAIYAHYSTVYRGG
jgi:hypothetical protein